MTIRSAALPILVAVILTAIPIRSYAFNLSQMLNGGEEQNFNVIHVADLRALFAKRGNKVHVYDANINETRERYGIIPGATLLSSDENYSLSVLPPDKHATLVFYCADSH